ncbi:hypothetical protein IKQ74_01830 [Candidatus Saccharibacteria bacterium]|nr:hypothetical protein [Candidatus Saccharibacteria bacterium]
MNDGKKLLDKPKSAAREPHKGLIAIIICSAIAVTGITAAIILNVNQEHESERSTVTVKDLTDEQKEKLGITDDNKASGEESEIEDEEHYSDEYKKYLELPDDEKEKLDVVPRKNDVPKDKIDNIKDGTDGTIVAELPQKFDLRDTIDITVGDQGDYGICWSFASSTALETHLKLRGIDYNPSEFQIDFLSSSLMYGSRNLHGGGSFQSFADVASSIGVISEDMFSGLNINTDGARNNGNIDLDYLKLAKNNEPLYVTKTVDFPSVYKEYGIATDRTEEELEEFRNLVKAHIMTNGSLYASTTVPWGWGIPRYCEKSMSSCYINHAVSIIGWDDTYPKEKFGKVNEDGKRIEGTPVHDGAYLVLNSYGEGWDGSGAKNGVYYISYDEYGIEAQLSGIVSTSLDDATKISSIASQTVKDIINEKLSFYIIEKDNEQYISDYARNKVSYLDLSSRGLNNNDLRGIAEAFPNLTSLYMAENNISDLAPMSKLKELYSVDLTKNNITDVSALCSEEKLSWIELGYNKITDVSCLNDKFAKNEYSHLNISGNKGVVGYENLTNLDALIADDIGLKSLESLRKLTKLSSLQVRDNDIKSLDGLSTTNTSFGHLDVSGNRNLKSLKFDKPVWRLTIDDAGLEDISILNDITASAVSAAGNSFNDLSGFNNKGIESLDLSRNKNLSNFSALGAVNNLSLSDCDIKSFTELSGLDNVKWLTLDNNKISSFDGAENIKNIISLVLTKNKLASLDGVNKLEKIQSLVIDDNQISSLAGIEKLTELSSIAADNNNISSADELLDLGSLYFASFNNNKFTSIPNFTKQSGIYLAFANNPLESAILPKNTTAINLKDCSLKHIDYSAAERLSNVNLEGNPDWNDYQNIISRSILKQQERGESYPYFYATTDYNFSEEDKNNLSNISGGNDYANWNIALTEYTIELKKSPEGIVNLEKQPAKRLMFMHLLRSGVKIKGFKIDKAATKLILDDKTAESLSLDLEQTTIVHGEAHLMTNKVKLVFKSDANG